MAAISLTPDDAAAVVERFRAVTGLQGELKGSRINTTERALLFEILAQRDARGWVAVADGRRLATAKRNGESDLELYSRLLDVTIGVFLPVSGGACADVVIDEGRYDPGILALVRRDIQAVLGLWGQASLADSRRCAGVQIADVVANSFFNLAAASPRAGAIRAIVAPWTENGRIRTLTVSS